MREKQHPPPEKPFDWRPALIVPGLMLILQFAVTRFEKAHWSFFRAAVEADSALLSRIERRLTVVEAYSSINSQSILNLRADNKTILLNQRVDHENQEAIIKALDRSGVLVLRTRISKNPTPPDTMRWLPDSAYWVRSP